MERKREKVIEINIKHKNTNLGSSTQHFSIIYVKDGVGKLGSKPQNI